MLSIFALCISALMSQADDGVPVKRTILALYESEAGQDLSTSHIHRFAEFPLNHLGYVLEYHDVRRPLPREEDVAAIYAAVLTWFQKPLAEPRPYLRWAASVARLGVRLIILGEIGSHGTGRDLALVNSVFASLGMRHTGEYVEATNHVHPLTIDPKSYEFEAKLGAALPSFPVLIAEPGVPLSISLELKLAPARIRHSAVIAAASPGGGYVASAYELRYEDYTDRVYWLINPLEFFARALGNARFPIPDVTTVSGRRLYFSHVDGDGWNNGAQMSPHKEAGRLSSEVMLEELIEPYPDLPVTIGLIAGDVLESEGGNPATETIARRMFALPHVEIGSHTCTHPFAWGFYEKYDRKAELALIEKSSKREGTDAYIARLAQIAGLDRNRTYIAGSANLPRAYLRNPFDLGIEVDKAITMTERLAPEGKKLAVYQWSGDTQPFEAAINRTRRKGLRNINGGDSRYDAEFPSMAYLAPTSRPVGRERQIYAVNSNENTYTNDWKGPYFAFRNLEHTVRNTETPRRLKGFNVYYHTYSAERQASLDAVKTMLALAREMRLAPITTSHYASIADSSLDTEIRQLGALRWTVGARGDLHTVRFDDAETLATDFAASAGVLGETRHAGSLYVTLDPDIPEAVITLVEKRGDGDGAVDRPVLVDSRWLVRGLAWSSPCGFEFSAEGFGHGEFAWRVTPGEHYRIKVRRGNQLLWDQGASADNSGRLDITLPVDGIVPVSVEASCNGQQAEASP